jgi:hypothetical protein
MVVKNEFTDNSLAVRENSILYPASNEKGSITRLVDSSLAYL